MKPSTKLSKSEGPEVIANIELGEKKEFELNGHRYIYRVDRYTMYKDYYSITLVGGPRKIKTITTCKKARINPCLKVMIRAIQHK